MDVSELLKFYRQGVLKDDVVVSIEGIYVETYFKDLTPFQKYQNSINEILLNDEDATQHYEDKDGFCIARLYPLDSTKNDYHSLDNSIQVIANLRRFGVEKEAEFGQTIPFPIHVKMRISGKITLPVHENSPFPFAIHDLENYTIERYYWREHVVVRKEHYVEAFYADCYPWELQKLEGIKEFYNSLDPTFCDGILWVTKDMTEVIVS